jgi:5-hydroxyisourate hydrolase
VTQVSTHVLDTARGHPAEGVVVELQVREAHLVWHYLAEGTTNDDGRVDELVPEGHRFEPGVYRMMFRTGEYFEKDAMLPFHPEVVVAFEVRDPKQHYHVPLLLSPYGYTTYRGS